MRPGLSKHDGTLARSQLYGIEDGATGSDSTFGKVDSGCGMILPFLYFTQIGIDVDASLNKKDVKMTHIYILSPTLRM